jgi:transposase
MKERLKTMDLHALLRRLRAGQKDRAIARALHVDRKTVKKYRAWAQAQSLLEGPLPALAELNAQAAATLDQTPLPAQNRSSAEAYRDEITTLLEQGLGPYLIYQKLTEHPEFSASPSTVWRLVRKLRPPKSPEAVGRIETPPGEVAQVDFGEVTRLLDPLTGQPRRTWAFAMVLGWSRHMYVEFVFDQTVLTWLRCHQNAFEFFQGAPQRVVLDNLKAAILKAYTRDEDPQVQRAYAECAEHYGFLIDPCLPAQPRHKGKVERGGVGYVQSSFMPLLPPNTPLADANRRVRQWLLTTAGLRDHGTTHVAPLARFEKVERAKLLPLPATAYDPAVWKHVKLHRDGHVVFEKSFYSAPSRLVGQTLWLRAGARAIRLFASDFVLVATHARATQPGERLTHPDHLPPEKARGLTANRTTCQAQAEAIGPATAQVVAELLASRPVDRLRTALRVLALADTYTPARLESACARGLAFGDARLPTLKRILVEGLDQLTLPLPVARPTDETLVFARPAAELAASILASATPSVGGGGVAWN